MCRKKYRKKVGHQEKSKKERKGGITLTAPQSIHCYQEFHVAMALSDEDVLASWMRGVTSSLPRAARGDGCSVVDYFLPTLSSSKLAFKLGKLATRVALEPNAGGKSVVSEALSMEYMCRRFGAHDVITEMEVIYWSPAWKKVDYVCSVAGQRVGVSVTRCMAFGRNVFDTKEAMRLMSKKLHGLVIARSGITPAQRYTSSILHCWCQTAEIAEAARLAVIQLKKDEHSVLGLVTVLLTVASSVSEIFTDDMNVLST